MGTRSFSLYFPLRAAKRLFLLDEDTQEDKGTLKRRDHKQTYKDREALHPTAFPEGSWGLCSSSGVVAEEFLEIIPI